MSPSAVDTVDQVAAAMSLAAMRHQVISSNIANRDAMGYQRLAVRFETAWEAAPHVVTEPPQGADQAAAPSLETDMVALSNNTMNYQALARALSRYFALQAVVAGGRA